MKSLFQDNKYVIVVDEGLMLGPEFLPYLAQTMPLLVTDPTLIAVSSWNPNGNIVLLSL